MHHFFNVLVAIVLCGIYLFFKMFPYKFASWMGGKIARTIGPILSINHVARENLALAFPSMLEVEKTRIIRDMWENLGRIAGEFPHIHKIAQDKESIIIEGQDILLFLRESPNPALFFAGHLANWEISPLVAAQEGVPIYITYRAANNSLINKLIQKTRSHEKLLKYVPKGKEGAKAVLHALTQGKKVGMTMDQKMNDGIMVPFFGQEAPTAPALARLARKFKAPIIPTVVIRLKGIKFKVRYEKPFWVDQTENEEEDIQKAMTRVNKIIEGWVRDHPGQWLWLHKRWGK